MEIKTPPPASFKTVIEDEDFCALTFVASGDLQVDVLRGQRFNAASLGESVFDEVVEWLAEAGVGVKTIAKGKM